MSEPLLPPHIIDMHNHCLDKYGGDKLVERMDAAGVERAVVMATFSISNETTLEAIRKHPDRFVGGMCTDPRHGAKALDDLARYHAEGFRLIKLFPNMGYYPDDDAWRPFLDRVAELKMAIISDCGILLGPGEASYYAMPGRWEKVARHYPETTFIMAHMGGIDGFLQGIMLATRLQNVYLDTAPGQGIWVLECAAPMVASITPTRILFGADNYDIIATRDRAAHALQNAGHGQNLEKIFYSNAKELLMKSGAIE